MPSQLLQLQTNWSSSDPPGNSRSAKSQPWVGNSALPAVPKWDIIAKQLGEAGRPRSITERAGDGSNYTDTRSITWPLSDPSKVPCAARQAINFPFRRQPRCTRSRQWAWHVYLQSGTHTWTKRKKIEKRLETKLLQAEARREAHPDELPLGWTSISVHMGKNSYKLEKMWIHRSKGDSPVPPCHSPCVTLTRLQRCRSLVISGLLGSTVLQEVCAMY